MQGNHSYCPASLFGVCVMYTCVVCSYMYMQFVLSFSVILPVAWFVMAPGVRLAASRFQPCALLFLTQCHVMDACGHTQFSTWVPGLRIQVLMMVQQVLLPREPSPQPLSFSLEFYTWPRLARVCSTASRLGPQVGSTILRSFSFLSETS